MWKNINITCSDVFLFFLKNKWIFIALMNTNYATWKLEYQGRVCAQDDWGGHVE